MTPLLSGAEQTIIQALPLLFLLLVLFMLGRWHGLFH